MDLIIGITGASGAIYGVRLLEVLNKLQIKTHLIMSNWGTRTIQLETSYSLEDVKGLATVTYERDNLAARVASGSFRTAGMVVAPCSMKTLAGIASGYSDNLITRAADITIKEGKKLILLPRETPLSPIHLENMLKLAKLGVVMMPPLPAFYNLPKTLDDIIDHTVGRVLDHLQIQHQLVKRWGE